MHNYAKKIKSWLFVGPASLLGLTALIYYPSLRYGFVFDDAPRITENFYLKFYSPTQMLFGGTRWIFQVMNYFTYHFFKLDPFYYRTVNLSFHLASGLLIYALLSLVLNRSNKEFLFTNARLIALTTSALFLLHPVQTQTVTYITQMRLEGVATFFCLAIVYVFSRAATTTSTPVRYGLYSLLVLLSVIASGTKEIIIVLPALLAVFDWFFISQARLQGIRLNLCAHLLVACSLLIPFSRYYQPISYKNAITFSESVENNRGNRLTAQPNAMITPTKYLMSQFKVITHYLRIFVLPTHLSFDYDIRLSERFFQWNVILPLIFLLSLLALAFGLFLFDPTHLFTFSTLWFFITVLPRASIIPAPELVCDYKTYMSSFGIFILMATLLVRGSTYLYLLLKENVRVTRTLISYSLLALTCIPLGFASHQRNRVWESKLTFWKDIVAKAPTKPRAYNNYAAALAYADRREEAIENYIKATQVDTSYGEPYLNLAFLYQREGNREQAGYYYRRALDLVKNAHPEMYQNLGMFNYQGGDFARAKKCFQIALQLKSQSSKAHYYLGQIFLKEKQYKKAEKHFELSSQGDLQLATIAYTNGHLKYQNKKWNEAVVELEKVYAQDPNYKRTAFLLGSCYYQLQNFEKASECFKHSYAQDPGDGAVRYNYAQALMKCTHHAQALRLFSQCNAADGTYAYAPLHIAKCYEHLNQKEQARSILQAYVDRGPFDSIKKQAHDMLQTL